MSIDIDKVKLAVIEYNLDKLKLIESEYRKTKCIIASDIEWIFNKFAEKILDEYKDIRTSINEKEENMKLIDIRKPTHSEVVEAFDKIIKQMDNTNDEYRFGYDPSVRLYKVFNIKGRELTELYSAYSIGQLEQILIQNNLIK